MFWLMLLIEQNLSKHLQANEIIEKHILDNTFLISWLSIQEIGFVLAKLSKPKSEIILSLHQLIASLPVSYNYSSFKRAIELANQIGFDNFNDCLHTAIAEQHCTTLYTYNHKDFSKIQLLTTLTIYIL